MPLRNQGVLITVCLFWIILQHVFVNTQAKEHADKADTAEDDTLVSLRALQGSPPYLDPSRDRTQPIIGGLDTIEEDLKPKARDLRTKKLKKKLGRDLDTMWMSMEEPDEKMAPETTLVQDSLISQASMLNFTYIDENNREVEMEQSTADILQKWLIQKSSCAVEHQWVNVGQLFWPHWIKHGRCAGQPCSWPEGMTCEPGKVTEIYLLRWYCKSKSSKPPKPDRSKRGTKKKMRCKWIKIPYPVTSECTCTCKEKK
ncbi:noggin-2-like [Glandiceps talaboti]